MWVQILGYIAMEYRTPLLMSLGCDVENLTLRSGATRATSSMSWAKVTVSVGLSGFFQR